MMKRAWIVVFMVLISYVSIAQNTYSSGGGKKLPKQEKKRGFDANRLVFGGNASLLIGNPTLVNLSPKIGYNLFKGFAAGVGIGYYYYGEKNPYSSLRFRQNMVYPSVWAYYTPWRYLFLNAEFKHNMLTQKQEFNNYYTGIKEFDKQSLNFQQMIVGGGFRQPLSERVSMNIGLYYDLLGNKYGNNELFYQIGLMVGL